MKFSLYASALTLAGLAVLALTSPVHAQGNLLISGGDINATDETYLTNLGFTWTYVDPTLLSTTSFNGYTGIWLGWVTTYPGISARTTDLMNFVTAGGNLLIEPYTNVPGDIGLGITDNGNGGNSVHIVATGDPLNAGLTDAGLSNWNSSYHDTYNLSGSFIGETQGVDNSNEWVTVKENLGAGHIVLTGQDISYHIQFGSGPIGDTSEKGTFLYNALAVAVPEPGTYALFASLGLTGAAFLRRRKAAKAA